MQEEDIYGRDSSSFNNIYFTRFAHVKRFLICIGNNKVVFARGKAHHKKPPYNNEKVPYLFLGTGYSNIHISVQVKPQ